VNALPRRLLIYSEVFPSEGTGIVRQTGVGRYCYELAAGLGEVGHDVTVWTNRSEGEGVPDRGLPFALQRRGDAPAGPAALLRRALELRRTLAATRAEHVIAGDLTAQKVIAIASRLGGASLLPILYGSELRSYERAFEPGPVSLRRWVRRRALSTYFNGLRGCICISRFAQSELQRLPFGSLRSVIVHPAVRSLFLTRARTSARELPPRRETADAALRIVTIGRISERKNQLTVLKALVTVRQLSAARFEYVILGNVDADVHSTYFREVQAFISEHRLGDQVSFVEGAADDAKIDLIDACDIVVAVSRTVGRSVEGFGISAIEGSARGKPVIVSDEGGMPETIREGVTGFSLPAEAHEQLAQTLADLAANSERRRAMGEAGRAFVRESFTPRRMGESLTAWLSSVGG
jgi:glycosyltransferase involved in cell wall biosynthesis